MTRLTKADKERQVEYAERLRGMLPPGSTVHTVLRHVSRSGMTRHIDMYLIEDGEPFYLSGMAAVILGERRTRDGAIIVGGCGMDMGFHLVYNLSYALYPDGYACIGFPDDERGLLTGCPANDHYNERSWVRRAEPHKDGGYALRHKWI